MRLVTEGYGLIEGPLWVPDHGLLFSDVLFGGVFALAPDGEVRELFPHRKGIGGMSLHAAGGVVVSGRNIGYKAFAGGATLTLLERDEARGLVGFNDITTDAAGRLYAGGLGASPVFADGRDPATENLYLIDLDGSTRVVARDVRLTNGLAFSPDGQRLYHSDSARRLVACYDVTADGSLGPKETFVTTARGAPDGLVVSDDGRVWVALAGGGGVGVYNADGTESDFLEIPHPMCTSVCFGGEELSQLYVVSGSDGLDGDRRGGVFVTETNARGVPVAPCRVPLP